MTPAAATSLGRYATGSNCFDIVRGALGYRFKVATMEGEPGKGCSVNNVNTGYDALGQPVLTQTYYHNCNCHAACQ